MSTEKPASFVRSKEPFRANDDTPKSIIDKILGDISKTSATKQLIIGASTGWFTGVVTMKIGKTVAFIFGGGIILLEVANEMGYLKINWDKIHKKIDDVTEKVEEQITGEGASWMNKMERYVDNKVDKAEDVLKGQQKKAKRWYSSLTGTSSGKLKEVHIFLAAFAAGAAIGFAMS